jgi:hypothetical protein
MKGTAIATLEGETAIEELRIGDRVLTASGEARPIKWIGERTVDLAVNPSAAPVKIARFAIDGKTPHADLYVSPAHALYLDGVLIPAICLVNGISIVANGKPELRTVTYYHIELESHDAILAEGLAAESFLGAGWNSFDNADEYTRLYGSIGEPLTPFAPIVSYNGGRQELASHIRGVIAPVYDFRKPIDKVRDRIADRAELRMAA